MDDCDSDLNSKFNEADELAQFVRTSILPSTDELLRTKSFRGIELLEYCTKLVSSLQLFSKNETIEDVSTLSVKYLLLPYLLGELTNNLPVADIGARKSYLESAIIYYRDFVDRCRLLSIIEEHSTYESNRNHIDVRSEKIRKLKELKELNHKLDLLRKFEKERGEADEETTRNILMLRIKVAINEAQGLLSHLLAEKEMLDKRFEQTSPQEMPVETKRSENSLKKPAILILTRDQIQKSVYGAGYPSVPTMTIDEWYDAQCQNASDTGLPERGIKSRTGDPELDSRLEMEEKKELEEWQEERDDSSLLQKRRNFDDYKDDHRRGSGNTIGKG